MELKFSPILDMELKLDKASSTNDGEDDCRDLIETVAPLDECPDHSANEVLASIPKAGRVTRGKGGGKKSKLLQ
ncbi:hypothetical protein RHMOL_Rhmol03G0070500 [Rhododendron molle]|uniref:Uncharacterized protein n=1 Tax=Rhododendron molle TaxID=49168 RepID=A0ACC0PBT7_RHOML|nr:hypothetical protein RHMOL_Rhmol03G0070500 [Rhododendron molle]